MVRSSMSLSHLFLIISCRRRRCLTNVGGNRPQTLLWTRHAGSFSPTRSRHRCLQITGSQISFFNLGPAQQLTSKYQLQRLLQRIRHCNIWPQLKRIAILQRCCGAKRLLETAQPIPLTILTQQNTIQSTITPSLTNPPCPSQFPNLFPPLRTPNRGGLSKSAPSPRSLPKLPA